MYSDEKMLEILDQWRKDAEKFEKEEKTKKKKEKNKGKIDTLLKDKKWPVLGRDFRRSMLRN
mgnify:CR=1 FL=1